MKYFLISLIVMFSFTPLASAITYYVDNSCSNNGNGQGQSCASSAGGAGPFSSLANAQSSVKGNQSDNSLLLKRGQIFSGQFDLAAYGSSGHPFTIGSYGIGDSPTISGGTSNIKINCSDCAYIVIDGITCVNATGSIDTGAGILIAYPAHHISVQNCNISESNGRWAAGIQIDDSHDNTINSNTVHDCAYYGILLLRRNTEYGITGNTISNNLIYGIGVNGIMSTSEVGGTKRISKTYVYGNEVFGCTAGIYFHYLDDSYIYRNKVHNNGAAGGYGEDYGFGVRGCSNNEFYENEVYDNYDYAWNVYGDQTLGESTDNNKFYCNYISGTNAGHWGIGGGGRGFGIGAPVGEYTGTNNKIYYNILLRNDVNLIISDQGGTGNEMYGNVAYGGYVGLFNERNNPGWTAKNNIFVDNSLYLMDANNVSLGFTHDHNLYYRASGGIVVRYDNTNYTLSTMKISFETSCQNTDPKFIGTSTWSDFRLQVGSPAIDAGANLGTNYQNGFDPSDTIWPPSILNQNTYGLGWEIGAYVYTSNTDNPPRPPQGLRIEQ